MTEMSGVPAVAARLSETRQFLNLDADFVAAQVGITTDALDEIESGLRMPHDEEMEHLATLYRVSVAYLLTGRDDAAVGEATAKAFKRADGSLTDREQSEVERFALFLQNFRRK